MIYELAFDCNCTINSEISFFTYAGIDFKFYPGNRENCEIFQFYIESDSEFNNAFLQLNNFLSSFAFSNNCGFSFIGSAGNNEFDSIYKTYDKPNLTCPRNFRNIIIPFSTILAKEIDEREEINLNLQNALSL